MQCPEVDMITMLNNMGFTPAFLVMQGFASVLLSVYSSVKFTLLHNSMDFVILLQFIM